MNKCVVAIGFNERIWIPPSGRPYWVNNSMPNAGPHLTDKRLKRFGLIDYLKYSFDKVWAESCKLQRIRKLKSNKNFNK